MRTAITRRTLAAAFVFIALALSGLGYWYYRSQAQAIHQSNYEDIAAITRMKAGQIVQWRKERILDVSREAPCPSAMNPAFCQSILTVRRAGKDGGTVVTCTLPG